MLLSYYYYYYYYYKSTESVNLNEGVDAQRHDVEFDASGRIAARFVDHHARRVVMTGDQPGEINCWNHLQLIRINLIDNNNNKSN